MLTSTNCSVSAHERPDVLRKATPLTARCVSPRVRTGHSQRLCVSTCSRLSAPLAATRRRSLACNLLVAVACDNALAATC
eukprot:6185956-Pleurochrysis_carterae.AAC.3